MKKLFCIIIALSLSAAMFGGCAMLPAAPGTSSDTNQSTRQSEDQQTAPGEHQVKSIAAVIPNRSYSSDAINFIESDEYSKYFEENIELRMAAIEAAPNLKDFYSNTVSAFLSSENENRVYSPLNIYMALAVLAQTASGQTRQQLLDLAGAEDMEEFKSLIQSLWQANYQDNPLISSRLSTSIWLRDDIRYNEDLLNILANDYFTDSFIGTMGTDEIDEAMKTWTNEHTGGLLSDYTSDMTTDSMTAMELISALYYKTTWTDKFDVGKTDTAVFHGTGGDTECEMMHSTYQSIVYKGENFTAVAKGLTESGGMYLVLPSKGCRLSEVLENEQLLKMITSRGFSDEQFIDSSYSIINLSLPKFDVKYKTDLKAALTELGVTDAFDADKADFSSLTDEIKGVFISRADHAARVMINEEGVTGAAYVDLAYAGAGMPEDEVDFVLDRPFIFFITGLDGSIIFAGTINMM